MKGVYFENGKRHRRLGSLELFDLFELDWKTRRALMEENAFDTRTRCAVIVLRRRPS